ncbi:hypothetical protein DPMN_130038 [Dreissena polymorpha]|uniref:Uncharacterized protein n=1 Tax=Dreissena polymorpha TaxID=45954 RepID=A0A9D4H619_DREPO|nr:hypothetical protein DPMN_130038 [Dreissena polymorpha]
MVSMVISPTMILAYKLRSLFVPNANIFGQRCRQCNVIDVTIQARLHRKYLPTSPNPDLAPMDFRVFPEVKSQLRGIRFASKQELTVAAKRVVLSFDADWYRDTFDKWISGHIKCIRVGGD